MLGNKRFAAILFVGLTLLAAGAAGAYYLTAGRGWTLALVPDDASAAADAIHGRSTAPADAGLDAVANAWAQPAMSQPETAEARPMAGSAAVALAEADGSAAVPAAEDRYGYYAAATPPSEPMEMGDSIAVTPSSLADSEPQAAIVELERAESTCGTVNQAASADADDLFAVARGQEPNEEASVAVDVVDLTADAADAPHELADSAAADPQPIMPAAKPNVRPASQRARDAFRDQPESALQDRYGSTSALPRGAAAGANSAAMVNPFEAAAAPASAASPSGLIDTLPAIPAEDAGHLTGTAPDEADDRPDLDRPDLDRLAPAANDALANRFGDVRHGQSLEEETATVHAGSPRAAGGAVPLLSDGQKNAANIDGTGRPGERALEGPQQPTVLIQKFAPGEIQVGKPAKFVIQIRNVGAQAADDVVVRDEVPQGTRLVSTSPSATANGNELIWQLGKLSAGEERTLEMQLMPVAEGEIGSVATIAYSAQASVKTRCTMPQLAIRMTAPDKVMIGQEQPVKIELKNPGSGDATGVMLFENVPENVRHAAGPALEFEIGTLRAGETRELQLSLIAEKAGKVVNVLTARADGNLQVQQQVEFEVIAPGLEVAVNGPERRYLERPATYEVSVENPGTAPAHDVQIITKLPKGMRFIRANNMGEYDATSHAVYWSLAELPEGESGTVEVVTMPVETGPQTLEVESRAGQGLVDQAKQQILVEGLAAIMFELRDLEDPIEVGGETGYEIRVVNQGTKAATNVQVAVNLPPGMQVVSAEGETQHITQGSALVFEPLPQLAPKADTLYRLRVQGLQVGDQRVTVEVNTDDLAHPIRREESTRVFGDE